MKKRSLYEKRIGGSKPSFMIVDEFIDTKLNGITPDHVVYDQPQPVNEYWCHIEMKDIEGNVKHENYEGISLENFEIIYGGIVDLITGVELKMMNDQQDLK